MNQPSVLDPQEVFFTETSVPSTSKRKPPSRHPVIQAVMAGDEVALWTILAYGGDANTRDSNGVPALHLAAAGGHLEALGVLLDEGAHADLEGPGFRRALHVAAAGGHVEVARRLLQAGCTVEVKDIQGNTPFMLAVKARHWGMVRLLVEHGANSNERVFKGSKSALMVAAEEGDSETVAVMLCHNKPLYVVEALFYANNKSVVRAIEDAIPGVVQRDGGLAVIEAARHGHLELMVALLDAGVCIDFTDGHEMTALMWASQNGHVEVVKELVIRGAALDLLSLHGTTALHCAAFGGAEEVVRILLQAGADVTKRASFGNTPLSYCATEAIRNILMIHQLNSS